MPKSFENPEWYDFKQYPFQSREN